MSIILPYHQVYANLVPMYNEPHRNYHSMTHIHSLLKAWPDQAGVGAPWEPVALRLAADLIWFHDCYYDPYSPGFNEQMSAAIARRMVECQSPSAQYLDALEAAIMLTARHLEDLDIQQEMKDYARIDQVAEVVQTFMDCDLLTFSEPNRALYDSNSAGIRAEVHALSNETYTNNRWKFLSTLMCRDKIYYTDNFKDREVQARVNIARDLAELDPYISGNPIRQVDENTVVVYDETWSDHIGAFPTRKVATRALEIYSEAMLDGTISAERHIELCEEMRKLPNVPVPPHYQ